MKRTVALGFFDGVHIGHAAVLNRAAQIAAQTGFEAAALTFDRAPREVLSGEKVLLITSLRARVEIIKTEFGMDTLVQCFDKDLRRMSCTDYLNKILVKKYGAAHIVCGADYRFGAGGSGDAEVLGKLCADNGIGCDVLEKVVYENEQVSSTRIRSLAESGDMQKVMNLLGRPFFIDGEVVRGRGLGKTLGFPTMNIVPGQNQLLPRFGVYRTRVHIGDIIRDGVSNIGIRPTVGGFALETFVLNFSGDTYGRRIKIDFIEHMRDEKKFANTDALRAQILLDIQKITDGPGVK